MATAVLELLNKLFFFDAQSKPALRRNSNVVWFVAVAKWRRVTSFRGRVVTANHCRVPGHYAFLARFGRGKIDRLIRSILEDEEEQRVGSAVVTQSNLIRSTDRAGGCACRKENGSNHGFWVTPLHRSTHCQTKADESLGVDHRIQFLAANGCRALSSSVLSNRLLCEQLRAC